jgi:hypothetical protein
MNYIDQLAKEHSRANTDLIAKMVGNDPAEFEKIIDIIFKENAPIPQRASWLLQIVPKAHPELIKPYIKLFIDTVRSFKVDGIKRGMLFSLTLQNIPKNLQAKALDICFEFMLSPNEAVAVKVYAMELASNITKQHPELKNELLAVIEDQLPKNTVAFSARARKVLKKTNG